MTIEIGTGRERNDENMASRSRGEYEANLQKLKLDPAPEFGAVDTSGNNSIDEDEWAAAEELTRIILCPARLPPRPGVNSRVHART
jgi:hypothetical protein